jgi:nucleoside-diphosphate-sugar epimerase
MRIVVTGGAGYLGSILVPMLLSKGHAVRVLDNFVHRENSLALSCVDPKLTIHNVDCRDIDVIFPHIKDADVIYPLAALVGAPICNLNPTDAYLLNTVSMIKLVERLSDDQVVINPSTESVYGKNAALCTEETPCAPLVSYGIQKLEVEEILQDRGNSVSFRTATLFGMSPRMRLDLLVNDFTFRAVKDRALVVFEGNAMRTYCHVIDAARGFVHILDKVTSKHEVYNMGSVTCSKLSLAAAIREQVPGFFYTEAQYATDPDARDYVVSDAKLRATGYESTLTLDQGITELLTGFKYLSNARYSNVP